MAIHISLDISLHLAELVKSKSKINLILQTPLDSFSIGLCHSEALKFKQTLELAPSYENLKPQRWDHAFFKWILTLVSEKVKVNSLTFYCFSFPVFV